MCYFSLLSSSGRCHAGWEVAPIGGRDQMDSLFTWSLPHPNVGRLDIVIGPMFAGKTTILLKKLHSLSRIGYKTLYITHEIDDRNMPPSLFDYDDDSNASHFVHNPFTTAGLESPPSIPKKTSWYTTHNETIKFMGSPASHDDELDPSSPSPVDTKDRSKGEESQAVVGGMIHHIKTMTLSNITKTCEKYEVIGIDEAHFFNDLVPFCRRFSENKTVIAVGLSGDFERQPFGHIHECISLCDDVIIMKAICMECFREMRSFQPYESTSSHAIFTHKKTGDRRELISVGGENMYQSVCRRHYHQLLKAKGGCS